jgi:gluconolactonase
VCPPGRQYGPPLPAARTARLIRRGFVFTEGPVWLAAQQAFYFSEFTGTGSNGRIHRYTPADRRFSVFVQNVGVNGLAAAPDGSIIAASHDRQRLTRFDPVTGARTDVPGTASFMGRPFNSTNDLTIARDGTIFFTDPSYERGNREGQPVTAVYRRDPMGAVTRIATAEQPNGIALSPDERWLYFAPRGAGVRRMPLDDRGRPSGGAQGFASLGFVDGLGMDCAGNVYATDYSGRSVRVFAPDGRSLGTIGGMAENVTNVAFGGADRQLLFITTRGGVYEYRTQVPGYPQ